MPEYDIESKFSYSPKAEDPAYRCKYDMIRLGAMSLAHKIQERCPDVPERDMAFDKLREAVLWANEALLRYHVYHPGETPRREGN
jgi:hypothetical protein